MFKFNYIDYLSKVLSNPTTNSDAKDRALGELRLLESTRTTLSMVLLVTVLAFITIGIAQCQLSSGPMQNHVPTPQTTVKAGEPAATRNSTAKALGDPATATAPQLHPADERSDPPIETESLHTQVTSLGLALLWSLAFYAAGNFVGFLFGIPKIAPPPALVPNAPGQNQARVNPNTNLEQISDWLTKIIVGVSLVEVRTLVHQTHVLMAIMASPTCGVACESLALAIIITFSVQGFFMGYLATRMFLSPLFGLADGIPSTVSPKQKEAVLNAPAAPSTATPEGPTIDTNVQHQALAVVEATSDQTAKDPFDARYLRAKSLLLAGDFAQAAIQYASLVAEQPNNIKLRRERLWALFKRGPLWSPEIAGILKAMEELLKEVPAAQAPDTYLSLTFHYLYAGTLNAAQHVIDLAGQYRELRLPEVAGIYVNEACAYGQLAQLDPAGNFNDRESKAAEAIRKAVTLSPGSVETIHALLNPTNLDNDLAVFNRPDSLVIKALTKQSP